MSAISFWLSFSLENNVGPENMVLIDDLISSDGQNYLLWVDQYEVTNEEFCRFADETGYLTTAEQAVSDTLGVVDSTLRPGSLIFKSLDRKQENWAIASIWIWKEGANWRHPYGELNGLKGFEDHPVVHISAADAEAYAAWIGKRLPTMAEWNHIAKMGSFNAKDIQMNYWTGSFPFLNTKEDGFLYTAPVGTYLPNQLDIYDMRGNVWEICKGDSDIYFLKGGSFLCDQSYCQGYKIENSQILQVNTSLMHTGFRCVKDYNK